MSSICSVDSDRSSSSLDLDDFKPQVKPKRTRQRLDHLSPNEKLQRRKMKNRIAAQTARDKRRAIMDHLEEQNKALKKKNNELEKENTRLREQLDALQSTILLDDHPTTPFEPAELINAPQQQEQGVRRRRLPLNRAQRMTPGWIKLISILFSMNLPRAHSCCPNANTVCCHRSNRHKQLLGDIDRHYKSDEQISIDSQYDQGDSMTTDYPGAVEHSIMTDVTLGRLKQKPPDRRRKAHRNIIEAEKNDLKTGSTNLINTGALETMCYM